MIIAWLGLMLGAAALWMLWEDHMDDPLSSALREAHRVRAAAGEALGLLNGLDDTGRACPVCRGVDYHLASCELQAARNALDTALRDIPAA